MSTRKMTKAKLLNLCVTREIEPFEFKRRFTHRIEIVFEGHSISYEKDYVGDIYYHTTQNTFRIGECNTKAEFIQEVYEHINNK